MNEMHYVHVVTTLCKLQGIGYYNVPVYSGWGITMYQSTVGGVLQCTSLQWVGSTMYQSTVGGVVHCVRL